MLNINPTDMVNVRVEMSKHNSNEGYEYQGKIINRTTCAAQDIPYPDISQLVSPEDIGITDDEIGNGIDYEFNIYLYNGDDDDYAFALLNASDWYHGDRDWKWFDLG